MAPESAFQTRSVSRREVEGGTEVSLEQSLAFPACSTTSRTTLATAAVAVGVLEALEGARGVVDDKVG